MRAERKFAVWTVDERGRSDVRALSPMIEGREAGEIDCSVPLLDPDRDTRMRTGPGSELVSLIDIDCGEIGGVAAGGCDALLDRFDAIGRLVTDQRLGGNADIATAPRDHVTHSRVQNFDRHGLLLGRFSPDLLFPLDVARVLRLTLKDDIAPGEIICRCLAACPDDAGILAAIGDRNLQRNMDPAQRDPGLARFGVEKTAQQLDKFVASEVFDLVGMDREHAMFLAQPHCRRNDKIAQDQRFSSSSSASYL